MLVDTSLSGETGGFILVWLKDCVYIGTMRSFVLNCAEDFFELSGLLKYDGIWPA